MPSSDLLLAARAAPYAGGMTYRSTGSMNGQSVLVTGATSGIGLEAARELATRGARVTIVGRNADKTARVAREVNAAHILVADLSELSQVRRVAAEFRAQVGRLDVLVNNAGVSLPTRQESREGVELTWVTNHLAPFLLTRELLPLLRRSARPRVVTTSSAAHAVGRIRFDDPEFRRGYGLGGFAAYAQSKLANALFTRELARREPGVQANALHPGGVNTPLMAGAGGPLRPVLGRVMQATLLTPVQGAQTIIYLAANDVGVSGAYFVKERLARPAPQALDDGAAARLWQLSESYVDAVPGGRSWPETLAEVRRTLHPGGH